jgi:hypothetical protein
MSCGSYADELAEVALGILEPSELPGLAEHLERCRSCRGRLGAMTSAADRILLLAPEADPPDHFEERIIRAIRVPADDATALPGDHPDTDVAHASAPTAAGVPTPIRRRARVWLGAAAAVIAVAAGILFVTLGSPDADRRPVATAPSASNARFLTATGADLGGVALVGQERPTLTMWLDRDEGRLEFRCDVVLADGSAHHVGAWTATDERRSWTVQLDTGGSEVSEVRILRTDGTTFAVARLPS